MESAGRPRVTLLEEGALFETKRMEAASGISWPRHRASTESVLVVTEGRCIVQFSAEDRGVSAGDSLVIPADIWHEIVADPEFKAVHIMPKEIRFTFST
ncbi:MULTISPECIES: cupin domain-containing protein [Corynebacterium]|uniref:cupin domain-containing protein n=1 Tax=Corynebacterium TaxID=1716 RepID=UPI00058A5A99|nr:cupin domain-containing protein [Corynebacterium glutamicum]AJE68539.1 hypothetical protein SB89_13985 [Corynebacterium glutamicum]OKX90086.1 hypothetical protein AUP72_09660 [Corynebacterium glutamicum]TWS40704.1 hypothetical protein AKJ21_00125 [Corynebacterium glutamicum]